MIIENYKRMENSVKFIWHKDSKETRTMYTKSRDIEIMEGNKTDEIIEELFEFL